MAEPKGTSPATLNEQVDALVDAAVTSGSQTAGAEAPSDDEAGPGPLENLADQVESLLHGLIGVEEATPNGSAGATEEIPAGVVPGASDATEAAAIVQENASRPVDEEPAAAVADEATPAESTRSEASQDLHPGLAAATDEEPAAGDGVTPPDEVFSSVPDAAATIEPSSLESEQGSPDETAAADPVLSSAATVDEAEGASSVSAGIEDGPSMAPPVPQSSDTESPPTDATATPTDATATPTAEDASVVAHATDAEGKPEGQAEPASEDVSVSAGAGVVTRVIRHAEPAALRAVGALSAPLRGKSKRVRDTVGWLALYTCFLGGCVWFYALFVHQPARPVSPHDDVRLAGSGDPEGAAGEVVRLSQSAKGDDGHAAAPGGHGSPAETKGADDHGGGGGGHGGGGGEAKAGDGKPKVTPAKKPEPPAKPKRSSIGGAAAEGATPAGSGHH
ncbi:MAG: hypothetical protein HRU70_05035 [Phycisphaeraceae bacterium]|nr:MAG: hypothetical protein HRU70_05035 [Phycisphaeraceae bacterium]